MGKFNTVQYYKAEVGFAVFAFYKIQQKSPP